MKTGLTIVAVLFIVVGSFGLGVVWGWLTDNKHSGYKGW